MNLLTCSKLNHFFEKTGKGIAGLLTAQIVKAMKLTFILLTAALLQVSATGLSQNVTLTLKNATAEKMFKEIERQTGLGFLYTKKMLQDAPRVNITVKNVPVTDVLKQYFSGQDLGFTIQNNTIVITKKPTEISVPADIPEPPPPIDIRGRVVNEKDEPVEGVSVSIKGTKNGTVTDTNGEFSLTGVDRNATLVFTSTNMETFEVKVDGKTDLAISLKTKISALKEVSVTASTGYQTISRERATGSYDVVGPEVLDKRPVSNLSTALQGIIAGMQAKENADGSVSFLIRGAGTMYGDTKPLVVVDGFPVADIDFSTINPNDVLSVTVLKDAAAASIWGARAANGVIVITTKRPKAGKLNIDVSAFTRISSYIDFDHAIYQANSPDHINYEKIAWDRNLAVRFYNGSFSDVIAALTLAQEYMQKRKVGLIIDAQLNAGLDSLKNISNRQQIKENLMQRAILSQFNLTLSGATERSRTFASLMYEKDKGGFVKNSYDRFMFNFNNQYQPTRFLTFTIGTVLQYRKQETSGATISEIQGVSPYETLLNPDGKYSVNLRVYNREQMAKLPLDKFPYQDWTYNLLREVRGRGFSNEDLSARIQAGINIKIIKGLEFDSEFQYERRKIDYENYFGEETFEARDAVNNNVKYNQTTRIVEAVYLPQGGILKTENRNAESYLVRNQLTYDRNFAGKHSVTALGGMEISQYTNNTKTNPWAYGYNPERLTSSLPPYGYGSSLDPIVNFRGFNFGGLPGGNTILVWNRDKFVSFYGNAGYTYDRKYSISGSVRSDASNYITKDAKLRWSPMWSVGAMWNVKQEDFMRSLTFIDDLRLRLTHGKNGNAEKTTSTEALLNMSTSISPVTGTFTATITPGNPFLRWEKTATTNLGIDFALFRNKLFGKIDLYNKLGTDITGIVSLPASTGVTSQKFNNAKILNKGIELELGTNIDITRSVSYNTTVTYAYNHNRVKELYRPNLYAFELFDLFGPAAFVEGRPVGSVYSFTYKGMINGVPNVEGPGKTLIPFTDLSVYNSALGLPFLNYEGTSIPPHTLGWLNNINVRDFYLTALFIGKFGGVYRNIPFNYWTGVGFGKTYVNGGIADVFAGDTTIVPGIAVANTRNTIFDRYTPTINTLVESSSFVECKEISIGYNLPEKLIRKAGMQRMKVFVQARNLGLIWKANSKDLHPEWLPGTLRPVSTYMIGANIQF